MTVLNGASNAGSDHKWLNYSTIINFDGNGLLTFNASGISDSYGGSLDMVSFTSPIPESEIYVMLLIGLGLLRFAAHRKKKTFDPINFFPEPRHKEEVLLLKVLKHAMPE